MGKAEPGTVEAAIAAAMKNYNLKVGTLNSVVEGIKAVTTGNLAIDSIIGVGGVPLGRSIELYGPPSSGKTTTALQFAAAIQQTIINGGNPALGIAKDDYIAFFDYEQALDVRYAKALGIDVNHPSFLFSQPDALEDGANTARALIATGRVRATIWDSVAAMTPQAALEAETGKASVALQARLMSDFLKAMNPLLSNNNCTAIFLNHIMDVIDMSPARRPGMPPRTSTPGGRALKFYASVRVEYKQIGNIKGKILDPITNEAVEVPVATNVKVRVVKNKVASPFREATVRVRFGKGFDNFWTAMQILVANKEIVASAGYFYWERRPDLAPEWMTRQVSGNKRPYIRGEEALFVIADEHPEWREAVIQAATLVVETKEDAMSFTDPELQPQSVVVQEQVDTSEYEGEDPDTLTDEELAAQIVLPVSDAPESKDSSEVPLLVPSAPKILTNGTKDVTADFLASL